MILTLKTASMETELGLVEADGKVIDTEVWQSGRELAEQLMTRIEVLLKKSGASVSDLSGIVVYEGPGSFTSLRIGLTVANTMAYSESIPIVGATGDDWIKDGVDQLKAAKPGQYVMPVYGAEANITKPKK